MLFSLDGFHLPPWNGVVAGWACHRCRMASFVSKGKKRIFTQPVKPHGRPKPVYFDDFEILMDKGRLSRKPASPLEGHNGLLASPGRRGRSGVAAAAAGGPRLESPPASSWKPLPPQFPAHKPHFTLPPPDKDAPSLSRGLLPPPISLRISTPAGSAPARALPAQRGAAGRLA